MRELATKNHKSTAARDRILNRDSWKVFQIMAEFVEGFQQLVDISPSVSIFGSARFKPDHPYYKVSEDLSRLLSDSGFAVVSGGGPGVMEAANKGAFAGKSASVGLNIKLPHEQSGNPFQDVILTLIQTGKSKKIPVILFGTEFWAGLLDWFENTLVPAGTISPEDMNLFQVTDDPQVVVDAIFDFYEGVDIDSIIEDAQQAMDI